MSDPEPTVEDRQYASELLADLDNGGMPRLEIAARWFRKARLEKLLLQELADDRERDRKTSTNFGQILPAAPL